RRPTSCRPWRCRTGWRCCPTGRAPAPVSRSTSCASTYPPTIRTRGAPPPHSGGSAPPLGGLRPPRTPRTAWRRLRRPFPCSAEAVPRLRLGLRRRSLAPARLRALPSATPTRTLDGAPAAPPPGTPGRHSGPAPLLGPPDSLSEAERSDGFADEARAKRGIASSEQKNGRRRRRRAFRPFVGPK